MFILALALGSALAAPPISSGATLLTGIGATFDGDPATLKIQVQGELPLHPNDTLGIGLVLPIELTLSGRDSFGATIANSMVAVIPSVRLRAGNVMPVRFYADAGLGMALVTADREAWLFQATSQRSGWATRFVLGLEVGPADGGVAFVFEPIGIDTLHFNTYNSVAYAGRIGVGVRY